MAGPPAPTAPDARLPSTQRGDVPVLADPAQHGAARKLAGDELRDAPARRGRRIADARARARRRGAARARPRDRARGGRAGGLPAGLLMDRFGRVPVLAGGFACGIAGCALAALGSARGSAPLVLGGLLLVGTATASGLLARTAAADMYPAERRARGIALVLFGSVFGAILGPAVFSPLLAGRELGGDALGTLWLAGCGFALAGLAIVVTVRPDPKRIAALLAHEPPPAPATALGELLRRPGVVPALVAAQASFAVM
ncbi:MAG: MFS transporter, partial [Actinobacteria bacterium]|nr:MFS transporter [Actinomycetota bacterium]